MYPKDERPTPKWEVIHNFSDGRFRTYGFSKSEILGWIVFIFGKVVKLSNFGRLCKLYLTIVHVPKCSLMLVTWYCPKSVNERRWLIGGFRLKGFHFIGLINFTGYSRIYYVTLLRMILSDVFLNLNHLHYWLFLLLFQL